jgi:hypothetical protein
MALVEDHHTLINQGPVSPLNELPLAAERMDTNGSAPTKPVLGLGTHQRVVPVWSTELRSAVYEVEDGGQTKGRMISSLAIDELSPATQGIPPNIADEFGVRAFLLPRPRSACGVLRRYSVRRNTSRSRYSAPNPAWFNGGGEQDIENKTLAKTATRHGHNSKTSQSTDLKSLRDGSLEIAVFTRRDDGYSVRSTTSLRTELTVIILSSALTPFDYCLRLSNQIRMPLQKRDEMVVRCEYHELQNQVPLNIHLILQVHFIPDTSTNEHSSLIILLRTPYEF